MVSCYNNNYVLPHTLFEVVPLPGALRLVQHLHDNGVPLAVATGSHTASYELKMSEKPELSQCFSHATCSDNEEVKRGKPFPDIFLVAASKFDPPPSTMNKVIL